MTLAVEPELAAEQAHVDRAYDRLDELARRAEQLATEERTVYSRTFAGVLERDAREAAGLRRRSELRLGALNLCFGRIDTTEGATYHLGRVAVDDDEHEPLIVDWRAPVAEPFYRATPADPLGLRRRRHLITKHREVLRLDDELLDDVEGPEGATDLVLVGEAALLDALRRARTGRMGDIVATIQAEQDAIIRAPLSGLVVVQGGPGTGKTAVALHRAAYLLYTHRFPLEQRGVLFVGPNPVFLRYIERVLPTLGESGCRMATVDDLVDGVAANVELGIDEQPLVARVKGEARMAELIRRAVESRQRPLRRVVTVPFGPYELRIGPKATSRIVQQLRDRPGQHNARRPLAEQLVRSHLARQYAKAVERAERAGLAPRRLADNELRASLAASAAVRAVIERIWPVLTPERLLRELFGSPALLAEAADGLLDADEQFALRRPRPGPDEMARWSSPDLALLDEAAPWLGAPALAKAVRRGPAPAEDITAIVDRALADSLPSCPDCEAELSYAGRASADWECEACGKSWRSEDVLAPAQAVLLDDLRRRLLAAASGPRPAEAPQLRTYGHVVVDEAQDLSPMQWRALARRCPAGSMTIVGDLGQASGHWAPATWAEIVDLVPAAPRATVVELTVNYRTPNEVMELAARVLAHARPDLSAARSVREAGVTPVLVAVADAPSLAERAIEVAIGESAAVGGGKVAVIAPVALVPALRQAMASARPDLLGDADDLLDAPVSVLNVDESKGLEFDGVVVVEPAAIGNEHAHGLGALYVALTRTTTRLAVVHAGALPTPLAHAAAP